MKRRITDLFKKMFKDRKTVKIEPTVTEAPKRTGGLFQPRKKPPSKWIITHNRIQAQRTSKTRKRRKKNKTARKSRQINYRKAA